MSDPTDADKAKAQRIVEEWHGNSLPPYPHRHLERRISQALADERESMRESCLREVLRETDNWDGETERPLRVVAERIRRLP